MKWPVLNLWCIIFPNKSLTFQFNTKQDIEIVIYQFNVGNDNIDLLLKCNERKIVNKLIASLKRSRKVLAKFLPNHIIEITQSQYGKSISVQTNKNYFKYDGATYQSIINIDKYIGLIIKNYPSVI
jgi:hypothetical protein